MLCLRCWESSQSASSYGGDRYHKEPLPLSMIFSAERKTEEEGADVRSTIEGLVIVAAFDQPKGFFDLLSFFLCVSLEIDFFQHLAIAPLSCFSNLESVGLRSLNHISCRYFGGRERSTSCQSGPLRHKFDASEDFLHGLISVVEGSL